MTCNSVADCVDGSDEKQCSVVLHSMYPSTVKTPAIVHFNSSDGRMTLSSVNDSLASQSSPCPEDHLHCPSNGYCLPVFLRCNGVYDCPGREDEDNCDSYTCPGLYRCRGHSICTRPQDMCDGLYHCPQHDDELFCDDPTCPTSCTCYGLAFFCLEPFTSEMHVALRYLEAARSGMRLQDVASNTMLVHLNLALCGLRELDLVSLPNLHSLDVRNNNLTSVSEQHLHLLPNLRHLYLASNPLNDVFTEQESLPSFSALSSSLRLLTLDMSSVSLTFLNVTVFNIFPKLQTLNLTNCGVDRLSEHGLKDLLQLRVLDLRGCPLTYFPADVFHGLDSLSAVFADNYKLCCPATLPASFNLAQCHAPSDEISSCKNLLRSDVYRGFLALFAGLAMVGNFITFVSRVVLNKASNSFEVFTTMLCVSDFLMGVYLAIIGIADRQYLGTYLWEDIAWRHSTTCKVAGFLSIVSSEVSALFICLITLERFLVIRFPLSDVHFRKKSALVVSGVVWVVGVILASLPLLPSNSHWQFYSLNGICVPLPITRRVFAGHDYSFALLIIFNFVLFLFIALGQVTIFWSVQQVSMRTDTTNNTSSKDVTLARRLITVAMTDFLCWFPIGLLGILAIKGLPISSEVNVAIAIFVLPLNSAINPFLYTLNRLLEKRRRQKEERLKQYLLKQMKQQMARSAEN